MTKLFLASVATCTLLSTLLLAAPAKTEGGSNTGAKPPRKSAKSSKTSKAPKTISAEEEKKILEFTKVNLPTMHKRLIDTKKQSQKRYQYMLKMAASHVRSLMNQPKELRDANIKLAQSKISLYKIFQKYLKAKNDEVTKAKLKAEIQSEVAKQFDAKMAIRVHKLSKLEDQLRQLQVEVDRAKQNRDKTIQRDTNNMIQHAEKGRMPSSLRPHTSKPAPKKPAPKKPAKPKPAKPATTKKPAEKKSA